ncbi:MAG: RdgB/HAM1 family non-canonical purine NTP pyrophosphatase [Clostridiales Family XIII bacterium]|jgi:XTP/dITP diphosphohydrolase|nr:RdgB/HAM1 family non-canonical purine NTP pyrophosphatase [Clostridiales Family XIII bacterium]
MDGKILIAATTNKHKITEISAIARAYGLTVVSRAEAGIPDFEIEETGDTFEENSFLKAKAIFDLTGRPTIADDSGLAVDALHGAPGVFSARFADPDSDLADFQAADREMAVAAAVMATAAADTAAAASGPYARGRQDLANNAKLLRLLADVPAAARAARFVSVITLLAPGGDTAVCRGEVEGHIAFAQSGDAGFGYDPLFVPLGYRTTFGLFSPEEKNKISHRSRALAALREKLASSPGV